MRTLASLLALALLAVPVGAQEKKDPPKADPPPKADAPKADPAKVDTAKASELAEQVKKSVMDGDYAKMADLTHPKIIEVMGGKDKMVAATKAVMDQMKAQQIEIKSYTIDKPGAPVVDDKAAYVILPTKMEMAAPKTKVVSESYLLGTSTDGGKTWTFVDGTGLAQGPVRDAILPNLPKDLKLPDPKPPMVTKEK
jgi:hypothetical protein